MRQRGPEHRIDQCSPDQIAGDRILLAEQMQWRRLRQPPQDDDERKQRHHGIQQVQSDIERPLDEQFDVVGDALVRIVGRIALQLHAIMIGAVQPFAEIMFGQPAPPADLQPLIEVELVDGKSDEARRQHAKDADLPDEHVPIVFLQAGIEAVAPLVQQDVDRDQCEFDRDHGGKQPAARPFVLGTEIGGGDAPHGGERRGDVVHRLPLRGMTFKGLKNRDNRGRYRLKSQVLWSALACPGIRVNPSMGITARGGGPSFSRGCERFRRCRIRRQIRTFQGIPATTQTRLTVTLAGRAP